MIQFLAQLLLIAIGCWTLAMGWALWKYRKKSEQTSRPPRPGSEHL